MVAALNLAYLSWLAHDSMLCTCYLEKSEPLKSLIGTRNHTLKGEDELSCQ